MKTVLSALRIRHWVKNLLVFVAPVGAGETNLETFSTLLLVFIALSFAASSTYLINDVRDIQQDILHPSKRFRAVASGRISPKTAIAIGMVLLVASMAVGAFVSTYVLLAIALYTGTATLYSVWLKRVPALDIVVLASLFVLRIFAGALAVSVEVSSWLLAISFFVFLSLAGAKRFVELSLPNLGAGNEPVHGRGYVQSDRAIIQIGGFGSGLISAMLIGQYIESTDQALVEGAPELLWLAVPLWVYWVFRFWILLSRGQVADDPVEFVLGDGVSYIVASLIVVIYFLWQGPL